MHEKGNNFEFLCHTYRIYNNPLHVAHPGFTDLMMTNINLHCKKIGVSQIHIFLLPNPQFIDKKVEMTNKSKFRSVQIYFYILIE